MLPPRTKEKPTQSGERSGQQNPDSIVSRRHLRTERTIAPCAGLQSIALPEHQTGAVIENLDQSLSYLSFSNQPMAPGAFCGPPASDCIETGLSERHHIRPLWNNCDLSIPVRRHRIGNRCAQIRRLAYACHRMTLAKVWRIKHDLADAHRL